jgi:medium-chain acyl-[acyl-carrier-protein] hydrolase
MAGTISSTDWQSWISSPVPHRRPRLRLFCFPYAGGGTSFYRAWVSALPPGVELCRVHLPGRENRLTEPAFDRLPPLVERLVRVLPWHCDGPVAFFGHSMGALIAFEVARELQRLGKAGPVHLFLSGHRAAQIPDPDPPIHHLPDAQFLSELRRLDGTPEEVLRDAELMQLAMPTLRADFAACETYSYVAGKPLNCCISAFIGASDPRLAVEHVAAWQEQTSQRFSLRMIPGSHFFLHTARPLLLSAMFEDLDQILIELAHRRV